MQHADSSGRVAIVGGGVTGLAAALALSEQSPHTPLDVWEADTQAGGVIQTVERQGCILELGPDSLLRRLPWGVDLCERLGLSDELIGTQPHARGVYTVRRGRLVRMPDGLAIMAPTRLWPMVTTPLLSTAGKLRMGLERWIRPRSAVDDESLAEFARRRFGHEAYQRIIQPLAGGVYMGDPERLSLRACFPQFHEMEESSGSLIRAHRGRRPTAEDGLSVFVAPRAGMGRIIERLAQQAGDRLHLGHRVTGLSHAHGSWRLEVEETHGGASHSQGYASVVLATPSAAAARLLQPVDATLSGLLAGVEYSSCVIVQLVVQQSQLRQPLDAAGIVTPAVEGRPMQACSFTSAKYAGRAPAGSAVLRVFFGGALRPELVDLTDDELIGLAKSELAELLGLRGEPQLALVQRWRNSMPQYHLGHLQRVSQIERRVAALPGLELAGAAYHGVGIPHCIRSAQDAVRRLAASDQR